MVRYITLSMLLLAALFSKAISLSDSATITLITVAPGEELYSAFGHTGIRVTDHKQGFDVVFNYGTFDFDQPGFYVNFTMGKMLYMMGIDRFEDFKYQYEHYEKRRVTEQVLNLTTEDQQQIFKFLDWNAQPENRNYRYDFFWDNCCTRPRDIFEKQLGTRIHYDYSSFDTTKTMRQTLKPYVANMPWVDFGFDLILGLPCEIKATPRNQTFLPDKLEQLYDHTTVNGQPVVTAHHVLVDLPFEPKPFKGITPIMVTFGLLMLALAFGFIERIKNIHFWWFDFLIFFVFGLLGTLFTFLGLFSEHYSVPKNLNCLWLIPTHLIVCFFLFRKQKAVWLQYYFGATFVLMLLLLVIWKWNPQPYNLAVLPLILLAANRAMRIFLRIKLQRLPQVK